MKTDLWPMILTIVGGSLTVARICMAVSSKERFTWKAIYGWILFLVIWTMFCMFMDNAFAPYR